MKIAFLTGSIEPGKDGVGDYTTGLADELRRLGHDVMVVALRDGFVDEIVSAERQVAGASVRTLRLPSNMPWNERIRSAKIEIDRFDPEWVSIQFVCYTFHPRGLVYGLAAKLAPLLTGRKVHIMFHETWLGKELGFRRKQRFIGIMQRALIQRFVHSVRPDVIHTSNAAFVGILDRSGIPATQLQLFGNVPVLADPDKRWIESQLQSEAGDSYERDSLWLFGLFGSLHPEWPPEPLLTYLHTAAKEAGKNPVILSIGRIGTAGRDIWDRMSMEYADRFMFVRLGEQTAERVSEYLSFLNFGIATSPRSIIGKSGTVIAMLEHDLPVIVNRDDVPDAVDEIDKFEPLLIPCEANIGKRLPSSAARGSGRSRRLGVARNFVRDLELSSFDPKNK